MHPMLNTAVKAARRAGNIINRATRNLDVIAVKEKAANDFVSEVDREAERAIISTLHEAYPGHAILAEESGASGTSEHRRGSEKSRRCTFGARRPRGGYAPRSTGAGHSGGILWQ